MSHVIKISQIRDITTLVPKGLSIGEAPRDHVPSARYNAPQVPQIRVTTPPWISASLP